MPLQINPQRLIDHCQQQLLAVYQQVRTGKPNLKQQYRLEGVIHAARLLNILSEEQARQMMESAHYQVFGESIEQRQARKARVNQLKDKSWDAFYDEPAINRRF
ncbi:hypothetical protein GCM10027098_22370 [Bowmanella dokdonensis]